MKGINNFAEIIFTFIFLSQINSNSGLESKSDKFFSHLSQNVLSHCSLIFVREGEDYSHTLSYLGEGDRKLISYQNFNFNQKMNKTINSEFLPMQSKFIPGNVKRMSHPCKLIFLFLKSPLRVELIQNIAYTICPTLRPTSQMGLDYFVFHSPPALLEKVLLMPEWPAMIKLKLAVGVSDKEELIIKTICLFCAGGKPEVMTFDPEEGNWFEKEEEYFPNFVEKMNGRVLRVSGNIVAVRLVIPEPHDKAHDHITRGFWKNLFQQYFINKFNFTLSIFVASHVNGTFGAGGTGVKLPNGIWDGQVGDLLNKRADIAINIAPTPKRIMSISISPFLEMTYLTFSTQEGPRIYSPMAVFWPFGPLMWMLILGSCALSFGVFHLITTFTSRMGISSGDEHEMSYARRGVIVQEEWGLGHQLFFLVNSFLEQDAELPRFTPFRCFVALWLIYAMILTCVYRSILVGLLAFPPAEQIPTTFRELADANYEVGFIKNGDAVVNTFKESKDPVYVNLLQRMEIIPGQNGLTCMENVINKPKYGCILFELYSRYKIAMNMSDDAVRKLVMAPAATYNMYLGMAYSPGSMFKKDFDKYAGLARDSHLPQIWNTQDFSNLRAAKTKWWKETNQLDKLETGNSEEEARFNIKQVSGGFWILFFGLAISTIVFAGEFLNLHKERLKVEGALRWERIVLTFVHLGMWFRNSLNSLTNQTV